MSQYEISFDSPWYLLLLLVLPVMWVFSFRSLAGLGTFRRLTALGIRTLVITLFVLALAEVLILRTSEKITVMYLLDQSESIPVARRQAMVDYVVREVRRHRNRGRGDNAGVIVFGRGANIEIPPFDADVTIRRIESLPGFRSDATNLAAAMKLALATFPEDSARRVVIVTDGNENLGDSRVTARSLADAGVGIDVVPVELDSRAEVAVEKVTLPNEIRKGQVIEARVIVNSQARPTPDNPQALVKGKLRLSRVTLQREELLDESEVTLEPGKNVFRFTHRIDQPDAYTYRARFVPDDPADDLMVQNNEATTYTHVRGEGRILLIEDWENRGDFDGLAGSLRNQNLEVSVMSSDALFTSLADLQSFDCVILANVPRASGDEVRGVTNFSDDQISMLVRNTEQMGCGMIMLGGPNSFGVGGWANTELEKSMPVDFQIKNSKVNAVGALVLMMHASEMAQGNHWQKVVARKAIEALGPMDYCGLIHWDFGGDQWLWAKNQGGLVRITNRRPAMLAALSRMTPGDMPQFDPAMKKSLAAFNRTNAAMKHMIVISDGDPAPPTQATIRAYIAAKVKVTTVAVSSHGPVDQKTMQDIAAATGGKYYQVNNPQALPKIYQREARRVSRPLIYEPAGGVPVQTVYDHEILKSIDPDSFPPLRAYVLTTRKENPLVEQSLIAPKPTPDGRNSTILATWTYGLGRTAVFTSDAGARWADTWKSWENYDKFYKQLVEWTMRPPTDEGKFIVNSDIDDGKVRVVITALDKEDEFLNFLDMGATVVGPDLEGFTVDVRQVAPGRYEGEFDADQPGGYFVSVIPGPGKTPISTGVNVPYSDEFRQQETNTEFLTTLASLKPDGGEAGKLIEGDLGGDDEQLLQVDTFRGGLPPAFSSRDIWPWLLVAAAVAFFADVFVRRVTIGTEWMQPALAWVSTNVLRRQREEAPDQRLERLRSRKAAIEGEIDARRAATRFAPEVETPGERELRDVIEEAGSARPIEPPRPLREVTLQPGQEQEEDYTSRLLKAKRKAWEQRKDKDKRNE
jgi:uncharacterized membrane protein/Mg-chelatase subunit ChlD